MKVVYNILVLIFVIGFVAKSDTLDNVNKNKFKSLIFISFGLPFSSGSTELFSVYNNEFSGRLRDYKIAPMIGVGTKVRYHNYRYGVQAHFLTAILQDQYGETVQTTDISGYREYAQTINVKDIPVIGTIEYMPYFSQFRTYIGGGIGFLLRNVEWLEAIRSGIPRDRRTGGELYNSTDMYPFIKIYTGVELGFDKMSEDSFLGSLVIEGSYNYSIGNSDYFKSVKRQFQPSEPRLNNKYNMLPGYLIISMAVTFNFNNSDK